MRAVIHQLTVLAEDQCVMVVALQLALPAEDRLGLQIVTSYFLQGLLEVHQIQITEVFRPLIVQVSS